MVLGEKTNRGIDFVFFDLGAGNNLLTMELFCMAHLGLIVSQPEPSSIENSYSFLKALLWQLYEHAIQRSNIEADIERFRYLFQSFKPSTNVSTGGGYQELLGRIEAFYPQIAAAIRSAIKGRKIGIVVNQVRSHRDEQIGQAIEYVTQKYYGLLGEHWGSLQNDDVAWQALRNRQCLVEFSPGSFMSRSIDRLGRCVVQSCEETSCDKTSNEEPSFDVPPLHSPQTYGDQSSGDAQQWKNA
jgi:flagellar biosynthesis protein FlhG